VRSALEAFQLDLDVAHGPVPAKDLSGRFATLLQRLSRTLTTWRPRLVVVQGDTSTATAATLAAFHERIPVAHVEAGFQGMMEVLQFLRPEVLVVDHHLLRDKDWRRKVENIDQKASELGVKLSSAAEFMGVEERLLEAWRRELWRETEEGE
jgi:predicted metallo-beta-lactamase superfamily hydrolase